MLVLFRSHSERNFALCIMVLETLTPRFYVADHPNYGRCVPVNVRNKKTISDGIRYELPDGDVSTIGEYSARNVIAWTHIPLQGCRRIHVVWDVCKNDCLNETTREKKGKGSGETFSPRQTCP